MKYYIGLIHGTVSDWELFRSNTEPTQESHGAQYVVVTGPFLTKRGAEFMRDHGQGNPHCQTVYDAERLARHYAKQKGKQNCISCGRDMEDLKVCDGYDDCPSYFEEAGRPTPKHCE